MIRALFVLWLAPVAAFWAWYALASNDLYFRRDVLDAVLLIYAELSGIPPDALPRLVAQAFALDGALVALVLGWRRRRGIARFARRIVGSAA